MLKRALCEWALVDVISKKEQIIFLTSVKEETKSMWCTFDVKYSGKEPLSKMNGVLLTRYLAAILK